MHPSHNQVSPSGSRRGQSLEGRGGKAAPTAAPVQVTNRQQRTLTRVGKTSLPCGEAQRTCRAPSAPAKQPANTPAATSADLLRLRVNKSPLFLFQKSSKVNSR